jgi:hypothetical protein
MKRTAAMTAFFLVFSSLLSAQLVVTLRPPHLLEGMAGLETLIQERTAEFSDEIALIVAGYAAKPAMMEGFSRSAATAALVAGAEHPRAGGFSLGMGSVAAVYADDFSAETLDALQNFDPEGDLGAGACIEPLSFRFRMPFAGLPMDVGATLGIIDAQAGSYGAKSTSLECSVGYSLGKRGGGPFSWDALRFETGGGLTYNSLSTLIQPGPISRTIPIDPDGEAGPLLPFSATLVLDPDIWANVNTTLFHARLQATTGFTLLGALSFSLGGGATVAGGSSGIGVDCEAPVEVQGYLANLVEESATISISGDAASYPYISFSAYATGSMGFSVGSFSFGIPIVYRYPGGFGLGAFAGMRW